jgi:hypothetical protein
MTPSADLAVESGISTFDVHQMPGAIVCLDSRPGQLRVEGGRSA